MPSGELRLEILKDGLDFWCFCIHRADPNFFIVTKKTNRPGGAALFFGNSREDFWADGKALEVNISQSELLGLLARELLLSREFDAVQFVLELDILSAFVEVESGRILVAHGGSVPSLSPICNLRVNLEIRDLSSPHQDEQSLILPGRRLFGLVVRHIRFLTVASSTGRSRLRIHNCASHRISAFTESMKDLFSEALFRCGFENILQCGRGHLWRPSREIHRLW